MAVDILPDSRTKRPTGAVQTKDGWYIPIYCQNCHKPWGMVPEKYITHVFCLCQACFEVHGAPAHLYMEPDRVFWERIRTAMLEEKIESLTNQELLAHADDSSSSIGKLLRERHAMLLKTT